MILKSTIMNTAGNTLIKFFIIFIICCFLVFIPELSILFNFDLEGIRSLLSFFTGILVGGILVSEIKIEKK